jgi:hypothetical protein
MVKGERFFSKGMASSDGISGYIMLHCIGTDTLERIVVARSNPASCCQQKSSQRSRQSNSGTEVRHTR